jgi:uncharacterized membrane protein
MAEAKAKDFFSAEEQQEILAAIARAEQNTSGEIRLHLEDFCRKDPMVRAAEVFTSLKMHKTEKHNGVLFYLAVVDHKFAVIADSGINKVVADGFWEEIIQVITSHFKTQEFSKGLAAGILMAGEALKTYFPFLTNDKNELSDDISFGNPDK